MAADPPAPNYGFGWLNSWKLHAALLFLFSFGLIPPLRSDVPIVAVYFPGAFIAMGLWALITRLAGWDGSKHPLLALVPVAYLIFATGTLFVAFWITGEPVYRKGGLASLIMTVPFGVGAFAIIAFRHRLPHHDDPTPDDGEA